MCHFMYMHIYIYVSGFMYIHICSGFMYIHIYSATYIPIKPVTHIIGINMYKSMNIYIYVYI